MRRLVPRLLIPLCVIACALAAMPWLRSFPVDVAAVPLVGAAVSSVLVPAITVRLGLRLWLGAFLDVVVFAGYTLSIVLRDPLGFGALGTGLYRGPSQILTFALPLVSPPSLLVAPVALTWLAGALAGECLARRWTSLLPYGGFLVAFGLAYAGTQRAAGSADAAVLDDTLLGGALLATLALLRAAQAWVRQDEAAEATQPDGVLPLRGFAVGVASALVIAATASMIVQSSAFPKRATTPQRVPSVDDSRPLGPVSFVAGLRPRTTRAVARQVFSVTLDGPAPRYFGIANVDNYDGAGWSFDRTFRPSGGVLPQDTDPDLRAPGPAVLQTYRVAPGPLTSAPWMPTLYRATRVTGTSVDIDESSGMIVPASALPDGARYTVVSAVPRAAFSRLRPARVTVDTAAPSIDSQLPGALRPTLDRLISEFAADTGVPSAPAVPFLQALQRNLRSKYLLSGAARAGASDQQSATPSTGRPTAPASSRPTSAAGSSAAGASADRAGGTSFADVLGSILGQRSGTPEQFATLVALVARELGVPARVVTGFRATSDGGFDMLPAGNHSVNTSEAWTWAEVPIVGQGWVVLDVAPGRYAATAQEPGAGAASSSSTSALPSRNALVTSASGGHAVAGKSRVPDTTSSPGHGLLVALLIASAALAVALLLALGSRKQVRAARRRRAEDPRTRLLGAWQESMDMLTEAGLPELTTSTSAEIALLAGEQFGPTPGEQAAALGRSANAVAYSSRTVVHPADVERAWAAHRVLRHSVRQQLGWRRRVLATMRYHRSRIDDGRRRR